MATQTLIQHFLSELQRDLEYIAGNAAELMNTVQNADENEITREEVENLREAIESIHNQDSVGYVNSLLRHVIKRDDDAAFAADEEDEGALCGAGRCNINDSYHADDSPRLV